MTANEIIKYGMRTFTGVIETENWDGRGVFYNPDGIFKHGVYVLTVKETDSKNDYVSRLGREGIFRVNFSVKKPTFEHLFGLSPKRPEDGGIVAMDYDFSSLNRLLPHPVYAWMGWVCVLNPDETVFESLKPLVYESYVFARQKYARRKAAARG